MTQLSKRTVMFVSILLGVGAQYFFASILLSYGSFQFHLGAYALLMYPGMLAIWWFAYRRRGMTMLQSSQGWGFLAFVLGGMFTELGLITLNILNGISLSAVAGIFVNSGYAVLASYIFLGFVLAFSY